MPDLLVIDPEAIETLRSLSPDDNDEFLKEVTGIFLDDTPKRIAELDESLAAGDLPKFTRAAHSIKGSAANLGAVALSAAAGKIEHHARTAGLADTTGLIDEVKAEFTRANAELTRILKK